jgi:hypothetical protein
MIVGSARLIDSEQKLFPLWHQNTHQQVDPDGNGAPDEEEYAADDSQELGIDIKRLGESAKDAHDFLV